MIDPRWEKCFTKRGSHSLHSSRSSQTHRAEPACTAEHTHTLPPPPPLTHTHTRTRTRAPRPQAQSARVTGQVTGVPVAQDGKTPRAERTAERGCTVGTQGLSVGRTAGIPPARGARLGNRCGQAGGRGRAGRGRGRQVGGTSRLQGWEELLALSPHQDLAGTKPDG